MMGKTHIQGGLFFANVLAVIISGVIAFPIASILWVQGLVWYGLLFSGAILGALILDIDHPKSKISQKLFVLAWFVQLINLLMRLTILLVDILVNNKMVKSIFHTKRNIIKKSTLRSIEKAFGHRGLLHTIFFIIIQIIIYLPFTISNQEQMVFHVFFIGYILGCISHLFLDLLTPEGVPLLMPFSSKRYSLMSIGTNSATEKLFAIILTAVNLLLFYVSFTECFIK